jgi:hypothetical protein
VETSAALDQLTKLDQVRAGSYEARLLRFSAIFLMAIWLKSDRGGSDVIYPLAPAPVGLQTEKIYGVEDFLKIILPLAQKALRRVASKGERPVP